MKKRLFFMMTMLLSLTGVVKAQEAAIKFTAPATEREFTVGLNAPGKVQVDWGTGELVEQEAAAAYDGYENALTFKGTPSGEVKIYAEGINYFEAFTMMSGGVVVDGISSVDVSKATALTTIDVHNNQLTTIDLSKNTALKKINVSANKLTAVDFSANTAATDVRVNDNEITSFTLADGVATLYLSNNPLGTLDLTPYTTIKILYALNCGLTEAKLGNNNVAKCYFSLNNNKLTSIDASAQTSLSNGSLFLMNNDLTEVKLPETVKALNITGNKFDLAGLYALTQSATITTLTASSMQDLTIADVINKSIDLSAQATLGANASVIKWFLKDGTELTEGTDYTVENGVYTFIKEQTDSVYATLLNADALPKLTSAIKTTLAKVTLNDNVDGINTVNEGRKASVIYDLKGQRVAAPRKGLYIVDGKKVVK